MTAILISSCGSIFLAMTIIFDRVTLLDCYENRATQAWFVSSVFGSILGLAATFIAWMFFDTPTLLNILTTYAFQYGIWFAIAGMCAGGYLYHYFKCFNEADNLILASWFASIPVFIFLTLLGLNFLSGVNLPFFNEISISGIRLDAIAFTSVFIVSVGLFMLEYFSSDERDVSNSYIKHLFIVMLLNILYPIIIDRTMMAAAETTDYSFAEISLGLLPFFWLFFAIGIIVMFKKTERDIWRSNLKNVRYFFLPIVFMEILAMCFFYSEILGLGLGDPNLIEMVIGLHAVIVLFASLFIYTWALRNKTLGRTDFSLLGAKVTITNLIEGFAPAGNTALQGLALLCIIVGLSLWIIPL